MISTRDIDDIIGSEAVDADNDRIGKVSQVYLDSESDEPVWVSVKSGLFGSSETLVPLSGANWDHSELHLPFQKDRVKDAPKIDADAELSPEEQDRLYEYYGLGSGDVAGAGGASDLDGSSQRDGSLDTGLQATDRTDGYTDTDATFTDRTDLDGAEVDRDARTTGTTGATADLDTGRGAGHDTSGPDTDDAMTVSKEQLRVGTERVESGRVRLRKYVVTEQQTVNVPVSHEEVRLEREPITDANRGAAEEGPALSDEEHEVVLTEERPVVAKETVPVERVRLTTEEVTENQQVTEGVAHEELDTGEAGATGTTRDADAEQGRPTI